MRYDVIVVGCGTMGSATALALARRGASVLALDRDRVPNQVSEHFGAARLFRTAYYEHPAYVPLLLRARPLWLELNAAAGEELYSETGVVYGSHPGGALVPRSLASAETHGVPIRRLTPAQAAAQCPTLRFPGEWSVAYEPNAGVIRPEATVAAVVRMARDAGVTIGTHEETLAIDEKPGEVRVRTDRATHVGHVAVVCAGAWTGRLLAESRIPAIRATKQCLGWMRPESPERFALGRHPCWAAEDKPGSLLYGFPILPEAEEPDFRVARHALGPVVDPDSVDRHATPADVADFETGVRQHLVEPGAVSRAAIACYSVSPDEHFIIDRVPERERVWVASGFSGHGFKFAPAVGAVVADLTLDGRTAFDLSLFRADRGA